jgi:NAD(P)-dependent dehydrogenase (short-subunit alcohol dehydrogenase family)
MLGIAREANMPGSDTALAQINRLGKPEEVAALTAFLLSDEATFKTRAVYTIDGGMAP